MTHLKTWWTDSLAEDIHWNLRQKEASLPVYLAQSPQIGARRYLVDWLAVICDSFQICATARHLAVTMLDYFMDHFHIEDKQLQLVAIGCLLVAAKFEEKEIKIPKSSQLNQYTNSPGYKTMEYLQMELTILDFYKWNVALPTAAHFTDYFLVASKPKMEEGLADCKQVPEKAWTYVDKYTDYFLEVSMQDHYYREMKPSLVGAACIAASRACLHISPIWSDSLQELTGYALHELNPAINQLLKTHRIDEESNACHNHLMSTPPSSSCSASSSCSVTPVTPSMPNEEETGVSEVYLAIPVEQDKSQVTVLEQTWIPCYNIYTCMPGNYLAMSTRIS